MKKLMTLMLGMSLAFGTVAIVFAQDAPKKEEAPKKGKKKTETPVVAPVDGHGRSHAVAGHSDEPTSTMAERRRN